MTGLKEKYKDYFKIGAAVSPRTIVTHAELLTKHFNSLTCDNAMKYSSVCKAPGSYDFAAADQVYQFARENKMELHGHCLVWHNQTPDFIFENTDREGLLETLRAHIQLESSRYNELVDSWDVVNEGIEDKRQDFLRETKWCQILGEGYMDTVFRLAKELMPTKKLFYNDYNEANPVKREKIYRLVKGMKERGVPIDGIGMQSHHNLYDPGTDEIRKAVELYAGLGVRLRVTEMDVSLFAFEDHSHLQEAPAKLLEQQAEYYEKCFEIYREYHEVIDTVTLWGVADDATWLDSFPEPNRKNWPLLFDTEHQPKEAFHRIMNF